MKQSTINKAKFENIKIEHLRLKPKTYAKAGSRQSSVSYSHCKWNEAI